MYEVRRIGRGRLAALLVTLFAALTAPLVPATAGIQVQPGCGRIALLGATIALLVGLAFTPAAKAATGGYPYASVEGPGSDAKLDTWLDARGHSVSPYGYDYRNCTDFVAWKLSTANGIEDARDYGDANFWVPAARIRGYRVDKKPAPGAVAWWGGGQYGHVAWVADISGRSVRLQEYNYDAPGKYDTRTIRPKGAKAYIHFGDLVPRSPRHARVAVPSS